LDLALHPRQGDALLTKATEVLYGGAAGGGKSHLMRSAAIVWCSQIPGLQVYLFRRIEDDLTKNHIEGPKGFPSLLAPWVRDGLVKIIDGEIRFWNGSKIHLCHCKDEQHRFKYLGAEIHVLLIDELTTFTETIYRFLRSRVRMVGLSLPEEYRGAFPRILCSSNPGNIGHQWVKAGFIDRALPLETRQMPDNEGGMTRQFIPAKLDDNPSMAQDDPGYRLKLRGLGSEALVRAMEDGDWDVIEGAFFDCWDRKKHVLRPVQLPDTWMRFRSGDWGSARPFSFGWWAVASNAWKHPDGAMVPRGALVRYREWYGAKSPNVGLKLHAEEVGKGLVSREEGEKGIAYGVLDPSAFNEDGGPSIAERIMKAADHKIVFRRADNTRIPQRGAMGGWDQMRARMIGEEGRPMIYCFEACLDSIRTIPVLQHDPDRLEDLNSEGEDHAADEWRYACMSRPYVKAERPAQQKRDRWDRDDDTVENWKTA
jgi:hypothetical protein